MYFDYSVVKEHKLYYFLSPVIKILANIIYDIDCVGRDNIPDNGKLIIACNHIAMTDPAFLVAYSTRTISFMSKSELFENPLISLVLRNMNAFPVKRNTSDRKALAHAKKVLENDWVLGIFPEGRRVRDSSPTQGKTGVAFLARTSGADVLPACIYKSSERKVRTRIVVSFGKVIKNCDLGLDNKDRAVGLKNATDKIMNSIKELWEDENERKGS